jgi:hypothetical protein
MVMTFYRETNDSNAFLVSTNFSIVVTHRVQKMLPLYWRRVKNHEGLWCDGKLLIFYRTTFEIRFLCCAAGHIIMDKNIDS